MINSMIPVFTERDGSGASLAMGSDDTRLADLGGLRVFIVEDSHLIRQRLTEAISDPGRIEVVGDATTEAGAVRGIRELQVDVVILDLHLAEGSGFGVLRALRQQPLGRKPTTIVLTNYDLAAYRTRAIELGADHFMDKLRDLDTMSVVLDALAGSRTTN